ncbi:MAG: histidinol-phosphatase [Clostridia bacterium]|nr:histidinol-phosphatase [Clostridia bacterium]
MNYNFHTHTYRCHHASGTPEEYVLRAIEGGIKYMGFSDHFPLVLPNGTESRYRVRVAEVGDYVADALSLREKYKDKIDIGVGFEMEYYPEAFDKMLASAKEYGAEYLICGQHFNHLEIEITHNASPSDSTERLVEYVNTVCEAIRTHKFTYIAHPDLPTFTGEGDFYKSEMRKIAVASRDENIPLEINFLGIREGRIYPADDFWQVAGEVGAPVTFGFDAHSTGAAYDAESIAKAEALVEKYKLNYIGMPSLIAI